MEFRLSKISWCLVIAIESDADDLEFPDGLVQSVHRYFFLQDLIAEETIIYGHVRGRFILIRVTRDEFLQRASIVFHRTELDPGRLPSPTWR